MKKLPIVLSAIAVSVFGCKVDQFNQSDSITPVFLVEGSVDQVPYRFIAGQDSVYHFTELLNKNSSINQRIGRFAHQDCGQTTDSACGTAIEFIFNDQPNSGFELAEGNFSFVADSTYSNKVYPITITPLSVENLTNCAIRVGNIGNESFPLPLMTNLLTAGPTEISVFGLAKSGIKFINTTTYLPTDAERCKPVYISIAPDGSETTIKAKTLMAAQPSNYMWSNGVVGTEYQVDNIIGSLSVTVVSDDGQCIATTTLSEVPDTNGLQYNAPQYTLTASGEVAFDQQEGMTVVWTDDKGQRYSSAGLVQDGQSYFTVTKVASYENNEDGVPTNSIVVSFRCFVREFGASSGGIVPPKLIVGKGKIALARP